MKPLVSVIIPAYNVSSFINETITSVKNQIYEYWECIVVNDGSIDSTHDQIISSIGKDKRFKYISQVNRGVSYSRNKAIKIAQGEFILCLDGDDLISPNFLCEMVNKIISHEDIKVVTSSVKLFGYASAKMEIKEFEFSNLLAVNQMVITSLFRKIDFINRYQFDENMREGLEDWDFWIGLLKNGGTVVQAESAMFYYRIQKKSRNKSLDGVKQSRLRYQMWKNHKELYSIYFVDIKETDEYLFIKNSLEYRIGQLLMSPLRRLKKIIS